MEVSRKGKWNPQIPEVRYGLFADFGKCEFDFEALVLEGFKNQHLEDELNLFSLSPFSSPDSSPPLPPISLPSASSHSLPDPAPHPSPSSSNRTFIPRRAIPSHTKCQSRKNRKKSAKLRSVRREWMKPRWASHAPML